MPQRSQLKPSFAVVVLSAAILSGCSREPSGPGRVVVAMLGEDAVYLSDLEAYLSANLLDEHESLPAEDLDRVKSRLFDAFLDERLLAAEAVGRGFDVSPVEVDAWLAFVSDVRDDPDGESPDPSTDERRREAVRRTLLLQKLQDRIVSNQTPVSDDDVRSWIGNHPDRFGVESRVWLRSLRFEDFSSADTVHRDLCRGRITFDEAVAVHGSSPDQGTPVEVAVESMIEDQRAALATLSPGQVSDPVETSGGFYLFQVVERTEKPAWTDEARLRDAEEALERERGSAAYRNELARLREKVGIRTKLGALPFGYVPVDSGP